LPTYLRSSGEGEKRGEREEREKQFKIERANGKNGGEKEQPIGQEPLRKDDYSFQAQVGCRLLGLLLQ